MSVRSRINLLESFHDKMLPRLGLPCFLIILFLELQRPVLNDGWLSLHYFSLARVVLEHFITLINVDLGLVAKVI